MSVPAVNVVRQILPALFFSLVTDLVARC